MRSFRLAVLATLVTFACTKEAPTKTKLEPVTAGKVQRKPRKEAKSAISPVYPVTDAAPQPVAVELCKALHSVPAETRARCCSKKAMGGSIEAQCVRTLSSAITAGAVTLGEASVSACAAKMAEDHTTCQWVGGPWKTPLPAACQGLITGTLTAGARCRSTLECSGKLRCNGAGASDTGVCGGAMPEGTTCGASADVLVAYTRQDSTGDERPECQGFCYRHKCAPIAAVGEACTSNVACGTEAHCSSGKCVPGRYAALGETCADTGCEGDAKCVNGRCSLLKDDGEVCKTGFECKSGCNIEEGKEAGVCGLQCVAPMLR